MRAPDAELGWGGVGCDSEALPIANVGLAGVYQSAILRKAAAQ